MSGDSGQMPVALDGEPAGHLVWLDDAWFASPLRDEHEITAHAGCGGRIVSGRNGAWCVRCMAAVPPASQLRLGLVLRDGLSK